MPPQGPYEGQMSDPQTRGRPRVNPLFLRDEDLREAIELMFFAYRDFTGEADEVLEAYGFGRAHHRIIYFVGAHQGITVGELLQILKITKQSLSRVLSQLVEDGFVEQQTDANDRRRRRLQLTQRGRSLEHELTAKQSARVAAAFQEGGADAVAGFRTVLRSIINEEDRSRVAQRSSQATGGRR